MLLSFALAGLLLPFLGTATTVYMYVLVQYTMYTMYMYTLKCSMWAPSPLNVLACFALRFHIHVQSLHIRPSSLKEQVM